MSEKKKTGTTATALTKKEKQELMQAQQAVLFDEMRKDADAGNETVGRDDLVLPFIKLLQMGSPEVSKRDPAYVKGAEAGMFINTVTGELYDGEDGLVIIPCYYEKVYLEWVPRQQGGGFVAEHATRIDAAADADPANEVVDTANHYVLVKTSTGVWQQAMIPMTSTKLRTSRRLNSLVTIKTMDDDDGHSFTPPRFAYKYMFTSFETENDKGRFFVPRVGDVGPVDDIRVYRSGRDFYELCRSGDVKVDMTRLQDATTDTEAKGIDGEDEVPF